MRGDLSLTIFFATNDSADVLTIIDSRVVINENLLLHIDNVDYDRVENQDIKDIPSQEESGSSLHSIASVRASVVWSKYDELEHEITEGNETSQLVDHNLPESLCFNNFDTISFLRIVQSSNSSDSWNQ